MDPVAEQELDAVAEQEDTVAELADPEAEQEGTVADQQVDAEAAQMVDTVTEVEQDVDFVS